MRGAKAKKDDLQEAATQRLPSESSDDSVNETQSNRQQQNQII